MLNFSLSTETDPEQNKFVRLNSQHEAQTPFGTLRARELGYKV